MIAEEYEELWEIFLWSLGFGWSWKNRSCVVLTLRLIVHQIHTCSQELLTKIKLGMYIQYDPETKRQSVILSLRPCWCDFSITTE